MVHAIVVQNRLAADTLAALTAPTGAIIAYGGGILPSGYVLCDGAGYSTSPTSNPYYNLFLVIGYTYGGSGGTFNVPDCRGRLLIGAGSGPGLTGRPLGSIGGSSTHGNSSDGPTLIHTATHSHPGDSHSHTFPSHSHTVNSVSHFHNQGGPTGFNGPDLRIGSFYTDAPSHSHGGTSSTYGADVTATPSYTVGPSSDPVIINSSDNTNPYVVSNYMIKV